MMSMCSSHADSLHEAKGGENRILERNYRITGNIEGKQIIIVDDVLTSGQSMADYKEEIERCGGKVVAAIFYRKNRYPAASASDKGARVGWLHREQNQGTDEMKE